MVTSIRLTTKLVEFAAEMYGEMYIQTISTFWLTAIYSSSLHKISQTELPDRLSSFLSRREEFLKWWSNLPGRRSVSDLDAASENVRLNVHLQLDYCLIRIFIGRLFLFGKMTNIVIPSVGSSSTSDQDQGQKLSVLESDCVQAALEIVDQCCFIHDSTGLARASFTEFSSCRGAVLVILAQCISRGTKKLHSAFATGLKMLRIMSKGVGSAPSVVESIEALQRSALHLMTLNDTQPRTSDKDRNSRYDLFKTWVSLWDNDAGRLDASTVPSEPGYGSATYLDFDGMPETSPLQPDVEDAFSFFSGELYNI